MKILVVEDDRVSSRILEAVLTRGGLDCVCCDSAAAALEVLEGGESVGLIITDMMMPDMDGLELLTRVRGHPGLRDIPAILCTALHDRTHVLAAAKLGIADYIIKPIRAEDVLTRVERIMMSAAPVLDPESAVRSRLQVNVGAYRAMLRELAEEIPQKLMAFEERMAAGDPAGALLVLSALHSAALNTGGSRLARLLGQLDGEVEADAGSPAEQLQALAPAIRREAQALAQAAAEGSGLTQSPAADDGTEALSA